MARASTSSTRNLSLTEELEKLEQSITLTLQEIDHNFSRAHRIVTTSILPIVEQYAEHSKAVWEGSKFWKQFFEASANVSLAGYEELAAEEDLEDSALSQSHDNASTYATSTSQPGDDTLRVDGEEHETYDQADDSLLDNADISGSTPRPPHRKGTNGKPKFADYSSPYEAVKQELKGGASKAESNEDETNLPPTTPGAGQRLPDMSMTPVSSPFAPISHLPSTAQRKGQGQLLHRILDKNYRVSWRENESPMSSPPVAAPQLRSEIFSSPVRQQYDRYNAPRTPGVSIQTPAKGGLKDVSSRKARKDEISWESDSDQDADDIYKELGMSPPKTVQFAIAPSRLLQTPAREASKRIVEDLLMTAGAGRDDSDAEDSPTMIKMKDDILNDSF